MRDAMKRIAGNTSITNFKPGAIARALMEAMAPEIPDLYKYGEAILNVGFLSKATEDHLDLIGQLFNYPRRSVTLYDPKGILTTKLIDDDTYRYEISQRVLTAANANYQALRLKGLAVAGVDNLIGKEYSHGTGSFSFILITSYGFSALSVKAALETVFQDTKAFGNRASVILPKDVPLELEAQLTFKEATSNNDRDKIRFDTRTNLMNYFGNFNLGEGFIYNDLVQQIMSSDKNIADFTINKFYLGGEPTLLTNHSIYDDERIVPTYINII